MRRLPAHFNRERILERVVAHAVGIGGNGSFEVVNDVTKYTRAGFLSGLGKKAKSFVRFSTVAGSQGPRAGAEVAKPRGVTPAADPVHESAAVVS